MRFFFLWPCILSHRISATSWAILTSKRLSISSIKVFTCTSQALSASLWAYARKSKQRQIKFCVYSSRTFHPATGRSSHKPKLAWSVQLWSTLYASVVWSPHTTKDIFAIESIQQRAARFVFHSFSYLYEEYVFTPVLFLWSSWQLHSFTK